MNNLRRFWLVLIGSVLGMAVIACSCNSIIPTPAPTPTLPPPPTATLPPLPTAISEPSPSLAGYWLDTDTNDVHSVEWQNGQYVVIGAQSLTDTLTVTSQSYANGVLTWTYDVLSTDVSVTFTTTSASSDSLDTTWSNTLGNSGTQTLTRVFSPVPPQAVATMPPATQAPVQNAAMAMGKWLDPDTEGTITTIDIHQSGELAVKSVMNPARGMEELTSSSYTNGVLTWEYCPSGMHCITSQLVSVSSDGLTLTATWAWSDGGGSGTTTYSRVP